MRGYRPKGFNNQPDGVKQVMLIGKGHCDARLYGSFFVQNEQGSQ